MFKYIIIFILFFTSLLYSYAEDTSTISERKIQINIDWEKSEINKEKYINDLRSNFKSQKQTILKEFRAKKISLREARKKILEIKGSYIKEWKKKLKEDRKISNNKKLNNLKEQVKKKIDLKLEKFSDLEIDKKNKIYEKVLSKIEKLLGNKDISKKQSLLYGILKEVFTDLLEK